ncbi:conserved membrane hypothetical protein [Luteimonas sp. 9C]|uniref:DUF2254 domain-containing protein n=1 Tax=Luteimonas sp. 9C TaxID=2653148 RepID=UPI0012F30AE2|nr:DUF2254 domain-containing protein [Luteimonas sp. 9C]VXB27239.1 conserved membrane hypothetical protein [Luteimonas sp. 9C]
MTLAQLKLILRRELRRMWVRATIYCGLAIVTALVGALVKTWIPESLAGRIGADSVGNLLGILATSMLAVTTFSLSTMVSAYSSASTSATPRATRLLIADSSAQGALATFIGAFLFSVVGLIALSTGIYGDSGRVVLFAATVLVIVLITLTLLRWIEQLSSFGRLGETIDLVEGVTRRAVQRYTEDPYLGAAPSPGAPVDATVFESREIGYVEHIDVELLATIAAEHAGEIHVHALPGAFASPGRALLASRGLPETKDVRSRLCEAFTISDQRSFEQDPRYGFVVLAEIGSRALSPSVNDAGTAIDIMGTATRLLCDWARRAPPAGAIEVRHARVFVPPIEIADVFGDLYPTIARDGAGLVEIGIRMQKSLSAIAACGNPVFAASARHHAGLALARAMGALEFEPDRELLRRTVIEAGDSVDGRGG